MLGLGAAKDGILVVVLFVMITQFYFLWRSALVDVLVHELYEDFVLLSGVLRVFTAPL